MATASKTATKAKTAAPAKPKTPAAKPAPATKKAAAAAKPKAAARPKAVVKPRTAPAAIDTDRRRHYVEVAAYFIAERRGFMGGCEMEDWVMAESEIDRMLGEGKLSA